MSLSRADLAAIRAIVRQEVAQANHARGPSPQEIGALVQGDDQYPESEQTRSMDPSTMAAAGASLSSQPTVRERMREKARADLAALRRNRPPRLTSTRSHASRSWANAGRALSMMSPEL